MARIGTGIMIILFWTGLASSQAGASSDHVSPPVRSAAVAMEAAPDVIDLWLADVAACEAGVQDRCAPVLL